MPYLEPIRDDQANAKQRELFEKLGASSGFVPNFFRTMAHAPAIVEATEAMYKAIHGDLPAALREIAYLKTSFINECHY